VVIVGRTANFKSYAVTNSNDTPLSAQSILQVGTEDYYIIG